MNTYLSFIVICLVASFGIETLSDLLNRGRLHEALPGEFKGIYDEKKYAKAIQYQIANSNFALVQRTLSLVTTLGFILLGGFPLIDRFARSFGWGSIASGLVFTGALTALQFVLSLPFSLYDTFVLEEKFGFNKTTPKTFVGDLVRGIALSIVLGGVILSGLIYFFESTGTFGWLYAWIAFSVFQIGLSFLAPALIMPLFNKFEPLPEGPLKSAIESYARTRNFVLSGIFTMDGSKRSSKSNAFFTGFGKLRRLVLFDTLISKQSETELVAVVAHEIGHFEKRHIIKSMALSLTTSLVMFYAFGFFMNNETLFSAFGMASTSTYAGIVFVMLLASPIFRFLSFFTQKLSRMNEFEADAFSVETYREPEALISALKKLSVDNLSHLTPHPLKVALDYTHPPVLERIQAIRRLRPGP